MLEKKAHETIQYKVSEGDPQLLFLLFQFKTQNLQNLRISKQNSHVKVELCDPWLKKIA